MDVNVQKHGIALLGATGSIGTQTLEVIRECLPHIPVRVLTGYGNLSLLASQIREFRPDIAWVPDEKSAENLAALLSNKTDKLPEILTGEAALTAAAAQSAASIVVNALTGKAGLPPTLAAIEAGKHIALANKESLVTAGELLTKRARQKNIRITPIDSEHSAIWQCLAGNDPNPIEKIILTASGGPFRTWPKEKITAATAQDALQHPNWQMGSKITIDSATMMNKGLELIEALHLFNCSQNQIEVVIHPQSIIHSAVQYQDGAVIAQLGLPDMRLPIQYALSAPTRIPNNFPRLDFFANSTLTFEPPDETRFPCLRLAKQAAATGGTAPAVMNTVNEWAVGEYLRNKIKFYDIPAIITQALSEYTVTPLTCLDDVILAEKWAQDFVNSKEPPCP